MPLLLDTPYTFDPGFGNAPETAVMVIIESVHIHLLEGDLLIQCEYGNVVDGAWVAISTPVHQVHIRNEEDEVQWDQGPPNADGTQGEPVPVVMKHGAKHFDILRATALTAAADAPVFDEVKRHLYQYLLDQGTFVGSIV